MADDEVSIQLLDPAASGDDPAGGAGGPLSGESSPPAEDDECDAAAPAADGGTGGGDGKKKASGSPESEVEDLRSSLEDRDARIASLERHRQKQDESVALLRSELCAVQIKHKEECYWLRLEVDNLRKDKEALEDRMAELYRDMREIDNMNEGDDVMGVSASVCVDSGYVKHLQSQLSKSMQTMGVLDNQIGMVKRSCDEVVRSLKEEIADVMDDKCRIEMELLNQLAVLDHEKRSLEDEYEREVHLRDERIKGRDDVIHSLREKADDLERQLEDARSRARTESGEASREQREKIRANVDRAMMSCSAFSAANESIMTAGFDDTGWKNGPGDRDRDRDRDHDRQSAEQNEELTRRVEELERENALLEDKLREERAAMAETSDQLRQNLEEQDDRIERLTDELEAARAGGGAVADAEAVLEAVHRDRDEALETLERVAEIWEKADESIQVLEDAMEDMRGYGDDEEVDDEDRDRTLSALETAALVHSQIKVSLLLVELKLRNQLTTLRNDGKLPTALEGGVGFARGASGGPSAAGGGALDDATLDELISHVDDVQRETLDSLEEVEKALTERIQALEQECEGESEDLRAELGDKIDALLELKERNEELEAERAALERRLDDAEGEKKELGRRNRELKGRAANVDQGATELRRELERLERENAELTKEKRALERTRKDADRAKKELERTNRDLERANKDLEQTNRDMEESADRYRKEAREAKAAAKESAKAAATAAATAAAAAEKSMNGSAEGTTATAAASSSTAPAAAIDPVQLKMFEKLQKEIVAVVGKIKEKNESISRLTSAVEEHKVREAALKKELKRIMKRVRAIEEGSEKTGSGDRKLGSFRRDRERDRERDRDRDEN